MQCYTSEDISVVIPAYNAADHIHETLKSVLSQTQSVSEVLVVDDCSTDSTRKLVEQVSSHNQCVKLLSTGVNMGGPAGPRNIGVAQATGKLIAFLDADDLWHPQKIEWQLKTLNNTNAFMVSTEMKEFSDKKKFVWSDVISPSVETVSLKKQLSKYRTPTSSLLVKREILLRHRFDERRYLRGREDFIQSLYMHWQEGTSKKVKFPLLAYRRHDSQISKGKLHMLSVQAKLLKEFCTAVWPERPIIWYYFFVMSLALSFYYRVLLKKL